MFVFFKITPSERINQAQKTKKHQKENAFKIKKVKKKPSFMGSVKSQHKKDK